MEPRIFRYEALFHHPVKGAMTYVRVFSSLLIAALAVFSGAPVLDVAAQQRAVLEVPVRQFDFGSVPQGAKVIQQFDLKNTGNAVLTIQRIVPSCGCTAAAMSSMTIAPGATEKIEVEFDTAGFSGAKTKTVQVLTSDLDLPQFILTLRGTVLPGAVIEPQRLEFGVVSPGASSDSRQREFEVAVKAGSDLQISAVRTFARFLTINEVPGAQSGVKRYRVELDPMAPKGELRDRVLVEFSGGRQPPMNVPVTASVRGDLRLVPGTVSFGVVEGAKPIERVVRLDNKAAQRVSLLSVKSDNPAVSAEVNSMESTGKSSITVRIDPSQAYADIKATLEVKTDHPVEDTLLLNVFGVQPPQ
jgi:hypothetical protein